MYKQSYIYGKKTNNIFFGTLRTMQDSLILFSSNTTSPIQIAEYVKAQHLTNQQVKNVKNKPEKLLLYSETPSILLVIEDFLDKKQDLTFVSDNVIKICWKKLDFLEWPSSPTLPKSKQKK